MDKPKRTIGDIVKSMAKAFVSSDENIAVFTMTAGLLISMVLLNLGFMLLLTGLLYYFYCMIKSAKALIMRIVKKKKGEEVGKLRGMDILNVIIMIVIVLSWGLTI